MEKVADVKMIPVLWTFATVYLATRGLFGLRLVGLTGSIASGKSTTTKLLLNNDICVIDLDLLSREATVVYKALIKKIVKAFGPQVLDEQGMLDRKALGRIVFGNRAQLKRLEAIINPYILRLLLSKILVAFFINFKRLVVLDVKCILKID